MQPSQSFTKRVTVFLASIALPAFSGSVAAAAPAQRAAHAPAHFVVSLTWRSGQPYRATLAGSVLVLRAPAAISRQTIRRLGDARRFVRSARTSGSRRMLTIRVRPDVSIRHAPTADRRGAILVFERVRTASRNPGAGPSQKSARISARISTRKSAQEATRKSARISTRTSARSPAGDRGSGSRNDGDEPAFDLRPAAGGYIVLLRTRKPIPVAAFRYGRHLWIVAPTREQLAPRALNRAFGGPVGGVSVTRYPEATVIRVALRGKPALSARNGGALWHFRISSTAKAVPAAKTRLPAGKRGADRRGALVLRTGPLAPPVRLRDPDSGAVLTVFPQSGPGDRTLVTRTFVRLRILKSVQGVAIEALSDGLRILRQAGRLVITHPEGLYLSRIPPT